MEPESDSDLKTPDWHRICD